MVGLGESTAERWIDYARAGKEPYLTFANRMMQARADFEQRALKRIAEAGQKDQHWTALAWILERTAPDYYGQRNRLQVDSRTERHVTIEHGSVVNAESRFLEARRAAREALGSGQDSAGQDAPTGAETTEPTLPFVSGEPKSEATELPPAG